MKTEIGFIIVPGDSLIIITRTDKYGEQFFAGYTFQLPTWSTDKNDAIIFKDILQASKFAKVHKGLIRYL